MTMELLGDEPAAHTFTVVLCDDIPLHDDVEERPCTVMPFEEALDLVMNLNGSQPTSV